MTVCLSCDLWPSTLSALMFELLTRSQVCVNLQDELLLSNRTYRTNYNEVAHWSSSVRTVQQPMKLRLILSLVVCALLLGTFRVLHIVCVCFYLTKHWVVNSHLSLSVTLKGLSWFNPIKPTVSYLIDEFVRSLNDQHDENIAEEPVVNNLLYYYWLNWIIELCLIWNTYS